MSTTTTTTDGQKTKASMISTPSQVQQITPQPSLEGGSTNLTPSASTELDISRDIKRPTDTLTKTPSNSHLKFASELDARVEVARARWERRKARRLERDQSDEGSK
jgi:hypothetical protein